MNPHQELDKLLRSLFSNRELHRALSYLEPDGRELVSELPDTNQPQVEFMFAAVRILDQHGWLRQAEFWDRLVEERRGRASEIRAVQRLFVAPTPTTPSEPLVILLVSASPEGSVRLRVDREFNRIVDQFQGTRLRDRVQFVQIPAATFDNLRTALMRYQPHVLHLSTHSSADALVFEDRRVPRDNVLRLLGALRDRLKLVVLNSCDAGSIARAIVRGVDSAIRGIDSAIGMSEKITDEAAIAFSVAFYEAIGFGRDVANALEVASAGLPEGCDLPELFSQDEDDPRRKRVLLAP